MHTERQCSVFLLFAPSFFPPTDAWNEIYWLFLCLRYSQLLAGNHDITVKGMYEAHEFQQG
jgi:hypothetical protein